MICYLFTEPSYFIFSPDVPSLLYYAQIPATMVALWLGFYIFSRDRKYLLNKLLLFISVTFAVWVLGTLIAWTNVNGEFIAFVWSFFTFILGLIAVFCIYFAHVFLNKKDISLPLKVLLLALLLPIVIFAAGHSNLAGFNITNCDAFEFESLSFKSYGSALGFLAMVWILILFIVRYKSADYDLRRQILLMGVGIELFLFSFFGMEFVATYFTKLGLLPDSQIELYGLVGMVVFMIYISILSVRYQTFHIKLFAAQAMVWGLVFLIGSQFFFIKERTNFVLNGLGFATAVILGRYLIRSVKREIEQREQLAKLNFKLQDLLKQRESLMHLINHKVKGSFTRSKYIFSGMLDGSFGNITPDLTRMAKAGLESDNAGIMTVDLVLNAFNMGEGKIQYDMRSVNFKELVEKVIEEKAGPAEAKGLKIEKEIGEGDFATTGDPIWLKEVVNNLVGNSVVYTKEGLITVRLQKQNNKILLSVKDTGVGLTEEDKQKLFTEGGRGKDSVKINVDSTGYGLYSVKLILDAHKSRVWAESEGAGKGSTFYVELPEA